MKTVKRFYCDYCRKGAFKAVLMERHESHCFKNETRIPYLGEVTTAMTEYESRETWPLYEKRETLPAWYPGSGKIWTGTEWIDVPGYQRTDRVDDVPDEVWPEPGGLSLRRISAKDRLEVLFGPQAPIVNLESEFDIFLNP